MSQVQWTNEPEGEKTSGKRQSGKKPDIVTRDNRKSRKYGNHGSRDFRQMLWFCQNAIFCHVLKPKCRDFTVFAFFYNNFSFLININFVILTQKYLLFLLLPKSICFVTYWLNMWPWRHRRVVF